MEFEPADLSVTRRKKSLPGCKIHRKTVSHNDGLFSWLILIWLLLFGLLAVLT